MRTKSSFDINDKNYIYMYFDILFLVLTLYKIVFNKKEQYNALAIHQV